MTTSLQGVPADATPESGEMLPSKRQDLTQPPVTLLGVNISHW